MTKRLRASDKRGRESRTVLDRSPQIGRVDWKYPVVVEKCLFETQAPSRPPVTWLRAV